MQTDMQTHDDILLRLQRLERESRRWKRGALALATALGATVLTTIAAGFVGPTPATSVEKVVEAERFVLRGADGTEHAVLGLDGQGNPNLLMRKGKAHAFLTLAGPGLHLRAPDGKTSSFLGIDTNGSNRLELTSERLQDGLRATVQPDGSAGFYAVDAEGRERVTMEYLAEGSSQLTVRDAKGLIRSHVGLDKNGVGSTLLIDSIGRRRLGMLLDPEGTPLLAIEDEAGRPRAKLTTEFDGTPRLELLREDGKPMFKEPK